MIHLHILNPPLYHPGTGPLHFIFQIRLRLRIQDVTLTSHLEIVRRFHITDDMLDQPRVSGERLHLQLDRTPPIKEPEEEARFVDCAARR
jgi:hypothetical protein